MIRVAYFSLVILSLQDCLGLQSALESGRLWFHLEQRSERTPSCYKLGLKARYLWLALDRIILLPLVRAISIQSNRDGYGISCGLCTAKAREEARQI